MIESICRLIQESGAEQVQINIKMTPNGAQVVLNTKLGANVSIDDEKALALRSALSRPLVLSGDIGNLDVSFTECLDQYIDSYVPAVGTLNSVLNVKAALESATVSTNPKAAPKAATKTAATTKPTQPASAVSVKEPVAIEFNEDEADSL